MSAKLFTATDTFTAGIASVMPSADTDMTCPVLCCVHISWTTDSVVYAATDRFTLAEHTFQRGDWPGDDEGSVSIPLTALKAVLAVIKASKPSAVEIITDGPDREGSVLGITFTAPGEFPRYQTLFPHDSAFTAEPVLSAFGVNPAYAMQLAGPKVKGKVSELKIEFQRENGATKPARVTRLRYTEPVDGFRGLLMPIRLPAVS